MVKWTGGMSAADDLSDEAEGSLDQAGGMLAGGHEGNEAAMTAEGSDSAGADEPAPSPGAAQHSYRHLVRHRA